MENLKEKLETASKNLNSTGTKMIDILTYMGFEDNLEELSYYFPQMAGTINCNSESYAVAFLTGMLFEKERISEIKTPEPRHNS